MFQNVKEGNVVEGAFRQVDIAKLSFFNHQIVLLFGDPDGNLGDLGPGDARVVGSCMGEELSDSGADIQERSRLAGPSHLFQSSLPEPVSGYLGGKPVVVFRGPGVEGGDGSRGWPGIIEDIAAGLAGADA